MRYKLVDDILPYIETYLNDHKNEFKYDSNGRVVKKGDHIIKYSNTELVSIKKKGDHIIKYSLDRNTIKREYNGIEDNIYFESNNMLSYANESYRLKYIYQDNFKLLASLDTKSIYGTGETHYKYRYKKIKKLNYNNTSKNKLLIIL